MFWNIWRKGHRRYLDLLSEYLDDKLGPVERARLEDHLNSCSECTYELESMRTTVGLLRRVPMVDTPRSFKLQQAPAEQPRQVKEGAQAIFGPAVRVPGRPVLLWSMQLSTVMAALLLVALLAGDFLGAFGNGAPLAQPDVQTAQEQAQLEEEATAAAAPPDAIPTSPPEVAPTPAPEATPAPPSEAFPTPAPATAAALEAVPSEDTAQEEGQLSATREQEPLPTTTPAPTVAPSDEETAAPEVPTEAPLETPAPTQETEFTESPEQPEATPSEDKLAELSEDQEPEEESLVRKLQIAVGALVGALGVTTVYLIYRRRRATT